MLEKVFLKKYLNRFFSFFHICSYRFVCEVATGTLVAPEYVNMIKNLLAVDTTDEHDEVGG